jgi:predicted MFS family arabinose efflux permease
MWQPMRHRNFRRFFLAAIVSNAGSWMQSIAVPFAVFEITNSPTWLGVTAFASMFVAMIANTPGGMLADRYPRRTVLASTLALQAASAISLWALWTYGNPTIANIMPLLIVGSIGAGLNLPAWQSFIPSLVPPAEISAAIRLNSMQFAAARSVGPLLGALSLKWLGASFCFMANAVSYFAIIVVLLLVRTDAQPTAPSQNSSGLRQAFVDVGDGWRYMWQHPGLRYPPLSSFINAAVGFGLTNFAPAMAQDQFNHDASDNGLLISAFGIGGVLGVAVAGTLGRNTRNSIQLRTALVAWVVADVVLLATGNFLFGLLGFAIAGCANSVGSTAANTSLQMHVDDQYRGRVMAVYMQMFFLGSALGSLVLGVVADVFSIRAATGFSALVFVLFHVWSVVRFDRLRILDAHQPVRR